MKKLTLFLISLFSLFCGLTFAQENLDVNNLPKLERYITDFTDTLTTDELNELEAIAENYNEKTTNQLVTVIIPDRQGRELFDIGMKIFNENTIGTRDNNGLLLLIAKNENKIRIIVWYGLEGKVPDLKASQIIENAIRPHVNDGQLFEAVKAFYVESQKTIDGSLIDDLQNLFRTNTEFSMIFWNSIFGILGIITWVIPSKKSSWGFRLWLMAFIGVLYFAYLGIFVLMAYIMGILLGLIITGKWPKWNWKIFWWWGFGGWSGWGGRSWWGGRSGWWGRSWWGFSGWGGRSGGGGAGD